MTPYYEADGVTIYVGDCRPLLAELRWHVTITDPPYGTGYYATDTDVLNADLLNLLADRGPTAVFGYAENLTRLCVAAQRPADEWVTWWPTNAAVKAPPSQRLTREAEHVAVFGDCPRFGQLRIERTRPLHDWTGPNQRGTSHGAIDTRLAGDVWTDAAPGLAIHAAQRQHPNEKPVGVMAKLVEGMTEPGQVVLDPFCGSGPTLRAARDAGRRAIGIELVEAWAERAVQRLAQGTLALDYT